MAIYYFLSVNRAHLRTEGELIIIIKWFKTGLAIRIMSNMYGYRLNDLEIASGVLVMSYDLLCPVMISNGV